MNIMIRKDKILKSTILIISILLFILNSVNNTIAFPLVLILMFVSIFIYLFSNKFRVNFYKNRIFLSLFIVNSWIILALFLGIFSYNPIIHYKFTLIVIIITISSTVVTFYLIKEFELFKKFVLITSLLFIISNLIMLLLLLLFGIYEYETKQFSGIYINRNTLAVNAVLLITLLIFIKGYTSKFKAYLINIYILLLIVIVLLTASVKGFIGIILVFIIRIVFNFNLKTILKSLMIFLFLIFSISFSGILENENIAPFIDTTVDRVESHLSVIETNTATEQNNSTLERLWGISESLRIIQDYFITGVGVHNSQFFLLSPFRPLSGRCGFECGGIYSHNNYLEILLNGGVFMFLLYYMPIFYILIKSTKKIFFNSKLKNFHVLIVSILILKLFNDIAMVSYSVYQNVFIFNLILMMYLMYNRGEKNYKRR